MGLPVDGRIEESINLSREEVRLSVQTSREIDSGWSRRRSRRLARPHSAVERLHEAAVDVAVVRGVDCRWVLLVRVLRIGRRYIHHADRQLTRLIHEAAELCLIHITGRWLPHPVTVLSGCHEIRVEGDIRADAARGALHLRAATARVESLSVETFAGIRLRKRRHIVRGGARCGSTRRSGCAGRYGVDVVIILCIAQGSSLRRRRQLPRRLRRRHGVRDGRRRREVHRRWRRGRYHLQTVGQLLQFRQAARVGGLMTTTGGGESRRRGVRVRWHRARLYVEIRGGGAGSRWAGTATAMLNHGIGVLRGEALRACRHCHVVALRYHCHVVRMRGVRGVRVRMRHCRWHAHRR